ncbi:MAG: nitrile hydratase subunit beta [Pseudomonadota bacterium]
MDGIHDLGGKDGFGPVPVDLPDFQHDWERRQWALSEAAAAPGGTIDWWRHGIECMAPVAYLSLPYFEKWCLNELAHYVDRGIFSMEEALSGHPEQAGEPVAPLDLEAVTKKLRRYNSSYEIEMPGPPAYAPGDYVRAKKTPVIGHTRLPAYARGHRGCVIAYHGGHLFPDAGAIGQHEGGHLYTVEFQASELWADEAPDTVCIDLWEAYLVPA